MVDIIEKILSDREKYNCDVKVLGPCTIKSPVRHHDFVREGQRILIDVDFDKIGKWEERPYRGSFFSQFWS